MPRQLDKALADYTKALELDPRYGDAYIERGGISLEKGQFD